MKNPSLEKVFSLQNGVIQKYTKEYPDLYELVSLCFDLLGNESINQEDWLALSGDQRAVYNFFEGDIFSTLINAARLCLQGCETDAYALMRIVLEELTVFDYISAISSFNEVYEEIKDKSQKPKKFSDKFRYEKAVSKLSQRDREKIYGIYSNIGAHLSPQRLALSRRTSSERNALKVGMILDSPNVPIALIHLSALFILTIEVLNEFFIKYLPNPKASPFFEHVPILNSKHEDLLIKYEYLKSNN